MKPGMISDFWLGEIEGNWCCCVDLKVSESKCSYHIMIILEDGGGRPYYFGSRHLSLLLLAARRSPRAILGYPLEFSYCSFARVDVLSYLIHVTRY
ncbi:hypothetical protein HanIR_Chr15g0732121 [Helianthus annuus]|nr:hypothetical protein HanIR_Chr15g0732121 [Helianthus annuus]